ncbi:MAG: hypothetical protein JXR53_08300 [Bacteroidales bacterium]|nr:hypothetical protein [Bacteroidales bacterium]
MHAYRFRINSDENEDFLRVVEVLANQSFEEFHNALVQTCKFKEMELASFYLCDNEWHRKKEITLMDMDLEDDNRDDDEDQKAAKKVLIMKDVRMKQIINDPHQKILYVFDFIKMITLNIELVKIVEADLNLDYPQIIDQQSELHLAPQGGLDLFPDDVLSETDDALIDLNEDSLDPDIEEDIIE